MMGLRPTDLTHFSGTLLRRLLAVLLLVAALLSALNVFFPSRESAGAVLEDFALDFFFGDAAASASDTTR